MGLQGEARDASHGESHRRRPSCHVVLHVCEALISPQTLYWPITLTLRWDHQVCPLVRVRDSDKTLTRSVNLTHRDECVQNWGLLFENSAATLTL